MSIVGAAQLPLEVIGGMVTNFDPADLPAGVSPDCPDCSFDPGIPGAVHTRPGTTHIFSISGTEEFTYIKTFIDGQGNVRNLYLGDQGMLWQEYPSGTFTQVNTFPNSAFLSPGMQAKSDTAFGREFIAFSDWRHGINIPRQWDGVNFDKVTQCGPGAGPSAAIDFNVVALTALSRTSGVISGTTSAPHLLTVGSLVNITGVQGDATFNGQFPVASVPTADTFTAWGYPGTYDTVTMSRTGDVVTAIISTSPSFVVGNTIIIAGAGDSSFDGVFTVSTIVGNEVTWAQVAANATDIGGTLYIQSPSFAISRVSYIGSGTVTYSVLIAIYPGQTMPFTVGGTMTISGNGNPSLNGAETVIAVNDSGPASSFPGASPSIFGSEVWELQFNGAEETLTPPLGTVAASLPDSNPTPITGIAGPAGLISFGQHQVSVSFIMRSGYITPPSPPIVYTALGGFKLQLTGIPTGTANSAVVGRIILLTASAGADFYYSATTVEGITTTQINDNITTTLIIDFSDLALQNASSGDYLFDLVELGEVAGFIQFANSMLAWGERNQQKNWQNLSFDGGFSGNVPLGWTGVGANGSELAPSPVWQSGYSITGDGATAILGRITQSAYLDPYNIPRIQNGIGYSVRVLLRQRGTPAANGSANVRLESVSLGLASGLFVLATDITDEFTEFIGVLVSPTAIATTPADLLLVVETADTLTNGTIIDFENVEIFPTLQPFNDSVLYGSAVDLPENFDGTTGFQTINDGDGRRITTAYVIRDRLYITKNLGGLYEETADPTEPFSNWTVDTISERVGCESINGIGVSSDAQGEDWVFILDKKGLYIHWATQPPKVSQEIQPTWDSINWAYAYTSWVVTDVAHRQVYIGVPMNGSQVPNKVLMMDFNLAGATAQEISDSPPVSPTFTGQLKAHMRSRKWSMWNISSPGAGNLDRGADYEIVLSNGVGNGGLYFLDQDSLVDNITGPVTPINAYYVTNPYPTDEQKQQVLQSKGNRVLLRYMTFFVLGQGNFQVTLMGPSDGNPTVLPKTTAPEIPLSMDDGEDIEMWSAYRAERISLKIQAVANGDITPWFSLQNSQLYVAQDPCTPIRTMN